MFIVELQLTLQHDRDTRMENVRNKLLTLGQIYSRSERYFPLSKSLVYASIKLSIDLFIPPIPLINL